MYNKKGFIGILPANVISIIGIFVVISGFYLIFLIWGGIEQDTLNEVQVTSMGKTHYSLAYLNSPTEDGLIINDMYSFASLYLEQDKLEQLTKELFTYEEKQKCYGIFYSSIDDFTSESCSFPPGPSKLTKLQIPNQDYNNNKITISVWVEDE